MTQPRRLTLPINSIELPDWNPRKISKKSLLALVQDIKI